MSNQIFHFSNTGVSSGQRFYLKDDVSGIFVRNLNIDSNFPVVASNLVYNTGNQNISGIKNFYSRPTVDGTGVLLSGEAINFTLPTTIVYTTGNQTISGIKTFTSSSFFNNNITVGNNLTVSGNSNTTGILNVGGNATFRSGVTVLGDLRVTGNITNQGVVLTRNAQTISGVKTFLDKVLLNTFTTAGYASSNDDYRLNIAGRPGEDAGIQLDSYGVGGTSQILARTARGIATGLSGLLKNDIIFNFAAKGYVSGLNNYSQNSRAAIRYVTDEDWVSRENYTGQGTYIGIRTTNIGSPAAIDKVVISTSGLNVLDGNIFISGYPVVNTTSDQTISGSKIFASPIVFSSGTNDGIYLGGSGGSINLRGGSAYPSYNGGNGGSITLIGGAGDGNLGSNAGSIDLSAGGEDGNNGGSLISRGGIGTNSDGGTLDMSGGVDSNGGSINTQGAQVANNNGGSIDTSGGVDGSGGNINTSNGGGSINTSNYGGSIDLSGDGAQPNFGGSITATAVENNDAGSLDMSAVSGGSGGSINTSGGNAGNGGSINTSNYGGSISLQGDSTGYSGGNITAIGADGANAGSLNMSAGNGGSGGSINTSAGAEGPGGSIDTSGSDDANSAGGSINTSAGAEGPGGSINTSGGEYTGGSINTSDGGGSINTAGDGSNAGRGGSINTSQGGGSIDTSNGGGSINTRGRGFIEFGNIATRTILSGNYPLGDEIGVISITLPNTSGTLALDSTIANTGSILDNKINSLSGLLAGQNTFTVFMQVTNSNPANNSISYFNNIPGGPSSVIANKIFQIGEKCIAKKAAWNQYLDTFTGVPNQNATGYFINVSTQSTGVISTVINANTFGTSGFSYVSEITPNIAVNQTDYVVCGLKWGNYTVGLRPSGWRAAVNIYCYN